MRTSMVLKRVSKFLKVATFSLTGLSGLVHSAEPVTFTESGDFSEAAVMRGVLATQAQCEAVANTVWASTPKHGQACIKYWSTGFPAKSNGRAIVFFHGDIYVGIGKTSPAYLKASAKSIRQDTELKARALDAPYVFIGRPGTHGSSGDHMQRRRPAESELLSIALDQIKQRLNIREFVLAGQSGGGHVTASLLTLRNDIVCAVPTSSPSSPRIRWTLRGLKKDTTGYSDSYEPTEHLERSRMHAGLRVFVLGSPNDSNVLWPSQTILADKLSAIGVPALLLQGQGKGPEQHGLPNSAREVALWCHHDLPNDEILRRARAGLKG